MNRRLFLISLIATLAFSQPAMCADETPMEVVYPFIGATNGTLLASPYLHDSFLEYLYNQSVYPVIGEDGTPLFYYSENGTFGCTGICSNITMNDYVFGSERLEATEGAGMDVLDESVVVGNREIEGYIDAVNSLRSSLAGNQQALQQLEMQLLEDQQDYLTSTYFENAYDNVFDYAMEEVMNDPETYSSLRWNVKTNDVEEAVSDLEKYLSENYDIDGAYDMSSLYSALQDKKMGPLQLEEFMQNVLDRVGDMEGVDLDTADLDCFSEMLNSDEFKQASGKAMEMLEENPELFEDVLDLAEQAMDSPEAKDMFKQAVDEMFENADWESVQKVMDLFNKLENKDQLLETLMEGVSEHMRDMVREGKIDEIKGMLEDPEMIEMMTEAAQSFSQSILEQFGDWASQIPIEFAYVIAVIATIATLIMLNKIKI
jgi:tetratricopeptide (TPR) repeat protein